MLSKFITINDKVDIEFVSKTKDATGNAIKKMYPSVVQAVSADNRIGIVMPMEQTKLVVLPMDEEYNLFIYGQGGPYQCFSKIVSRYKSNNVYVLVFELTSKLKKHQRREFFRLSCALDMQMRTLVKEEIDLLKQEKFLPIEDLEFNKSIVIDISGGGLKFVTRENYEPETLIYCKFTLLNNGKPSKFEIVGDVMSKKPMDHRPNFYEYRMKYLNLEREGRENLIKYIFDRDRENRKKEKER